MTELCLPQDGYGVFTLEYSRGTGMYECSRITLENNAIKLTDMPEYRFQLGDSAQEAFAAGLIAGVVIMIVLAVKNRASQNNMIQTMPMKRFCICLVAGSVSSFLVSGCLSMLPAAMSSFVGVIIFFLVIAAYSALLFFLIYKPLEAKVGKSYALVGGIAFSVVIAIVLATMGVNAITSLPLCIILAAAYTAIIYAYAAKFEKKKNRF